MQDFVIVESITSLLTLIWNWHGHEFSRIWKLSVNFLKKCRDFLGRYILGTTFFRAESSLIQSSCRSFIRVIAPYEISKVNSRLETKICKMSILFYFITWHFGPVVCDTVRKLMHQTTQQVNKHWHGRKGWEKESNTVKGAR